MTAAINMYIKNGFFHCEVSEGSSRVRTSSVPPEFSPEAKTQEATTPEAQLKSLTPLPFDSKLQRREAWADMSTDDEAESDDELLRTSSDDTKYTTDSETSSICGYAPSPVSTCATPSGIQKTPLRRKATPFKPARPCVPKEVCQFFPQEDAAKFTALKLGAPLRRKATPFQPARPRIPKEVCQFVPQDDAAKFTALKLAAPWRSSPWRKPP